MSVESTALDRSALERKARDELATIAQDLGLKPRSRDRKAEIVQAILETTGAEPTGVTGARAAQGSGAGPGDGGRGNGGSALPTNSNPPSTGDQGGSPVSRPSSDQPDPGAGTSGPPASAQPADQQLRFDASPADGPGAGGGATDDKVVDLTTHDTQNTGDEAPAGSGSAAPTGEGPSASAAPAADGPAGSGSGGSAAPAGAGDGTDRPGPQDGDTGATPGAGDSGDGRSNGSDQGTHREEGNRDEARRGDGQKQGQQGQQRGQGGQGGGRSDQQRARNGQNQKGGGQQDAEPGNRRRRRRGRNRGGESAPEEFTGEPVEVEGLLDLRDEGYGFLRVRGTRPSKEDIYVSVKQARQFSLRKGDHVKGASRPAQRNEKNPALLRIDAVNGGDPEVARKRRKFEDLTPLFPDEKLSLETVDDSSNMTARIMDLIAPIGKGQRGLIVSPPKAGKTTIMKQIVRSIEINNPEVKLLVLLVDERPEEVTDMRRWLRNDDSEVVASTFDRPADEHAHVAELSIERAKRMVEDGRDVCIVLDGITRLARAYNLAAPATGRIMSGGVDSGALYPPKKFFGAARNVEEGGSLSILATALIETGSKMDEVIFEEFKGTGNMELRLDRRLAERRIYPAIDVDASSTRHEELLFPRGQLNLVWALRRVLSGLSSTDGGNAAALELLIDRMKTFRTNDEFLAEVAKNRLAAG